MSVLFITTLLGLQLFLTNAQNPSPSNSAAYCSQPHLQNYHSCVDNALFYGTVGDHSRCYWDKSTETCEFDPCLAVLFSASESCPSTYDGNAITCDKVETLFGVSGNAKAGFPNENYVAFCGTTKREARLFEIAHYCGLESNTIELCDQGTSTNRDKFCELDTQSTGKCHPKESAYEVRCETSTQLYDCFVRTCSIENFECRSDDCAYIDKINEVMDGSGACGNTCEDTSVTVNGVAYGLCYENTARAASKTASFNCNGATTYESCILKNDPSDPLNADRCMWDPAIQKCIHDSCISRSIYESTCTSGCQTFESWTDQIFCGTTLDYAKKYEAVWTCYMHPNTIGVGRCYDAGASYIPTLLEYMNPEGRTHVPTKYPTEAPTTKSPTRYPTHAPIPGVTNPPVVDPTKSPTTLPPSTAFPTPFDHCQYLVMLPREDDDSRENWNNFVAYSFNTPSDGCTPNNCGYIDTPECCDPWIERSWIGTYQYAMDEGYVGYMQEKHWDRNKGLFSKSADIGELAEAAKMRFGATTGGSFNFWIDMDFVHTNPPHNHYWRTSSANLDHPWDISDLVDPGTRQHWIVHPKLNSNFKRLSGDPYEYPNDDYSKIPNGFYFTCDKCRDITSESACLESKNCDWRTLQDVQDTIDASAQCSFSVCKANLNFGLDENDSSDAATILANNKLGVGTSYMYYQGTDLSTYGGGNSAANTLAHSLLTTPCTFGKPFTDAPTTNAPTKSPTAPTEAPTLASTCGAFEITKTGINYNSGPYFSFDDRQVVYTKYDFNDYRATVSDELTYYMFLGKTSDTAFQTAYFVSKTAGVVNTDTGYYDQPSNTDLVLYAEFLGNDAPAHPTHPTLLSSGNWDVGWKWKNTGSSLWYPLDVEGVDFDNLRGDGTGFVVTCTSFTQAPTTAEPTDAPTTPTSPTEFPTESPTENPTTSAPTPATLAPTLPFYQIIESGRCDTYGNGYSDIRTEADCITYAQTIPGKTGINGIAVNDSPIGCYRFSDYQVWWHPHDDGDHDSHGGPHGDEIDCSPTRRCVCALYAPTEAPTSSPTESPTTSPTASPTTIQVECDNLANSEDFDGCYTSTYCRIFFDLLAQTEKHCYADPCKAHCSSGCDSIDDDKGGIICYGPAHKQNALMRLEHQKCLDQDTNEDPGYDMTYLTNLHDIDVCSKDAQGDMVFSPSLVPVCFFHEDEDHFITIYNTLCPYDTQDTNVVFVSVPHASNWSFTISNFGLNDIKDVDESNACVDGAGFQKNANNIYHDAGTVAATANGDHLDIDATGVIGVYFPLVDSFTGDFSVTNAQIYTKDVCSKSVQVNTAPTAAPTASPTESPTTAGSCTAFEITKSGITYTGPYIENQYNFHGENDYRSDGTTTYYMFRALTADQSTPGKTAYYISKEAGVYNAVADENDPPSNEDMVLYAELGDSAPSHPVLLVNGPSENVGWKWKNLGLSHWYPGTEINPDLANLKDDGGGYVITCVSYTGAPTSSPTGSPTDAPTEGSAPPTDQPTAGTAPPSTAAPTTPFSGICPSGPTGPQCCDNFNDCTGEACFGSENQAQCDQCSGTYSVTTKMTSYADNEIAMTIQDVLAMLTYGLSNSPVPNLYLTQQTNGIACWGNFTMTEFFLMIPLYQNHFPPSPSPSSSRRLLGIVRNKKRRLAYGEQGVTVTYVDCGGGEGNYVIVPDNTQNVGFNVGPKTLIDAGVLSNTSCVSGLTPGPTGLYHEATSYFSIMGGVHGISVAASTAERIVVPVHESLANGLILTKIVTSGENFDDRMLKNDVTLDIVVCGSHTFLKISSPVAFSELNFQTIPADTAKISAVQTATQGELNACGISGGYLTQNGATFFSDPAPDGASFSGSSTWAIGFNPTATVSECLVPLISGADIGSFKISIQLMKDINTNTYINGNGDVFLLAAPTAPPTSPTESPTESPTQSPTATAPTPTESPTTFVDNCAGTSFDNCIPQNSGCAWDGNNCIRDICKEELADTGTCGANCKTEMYDGTEYCSSFQSNVEIMTDFERCNDLASLVYIAECACDRDDYAATLDETLIQFCLYNENLGAGVPCDPENCPSDAPTTGAPTNAPTEGEYEWPGEYEQSCSDQTNAKDCFSYDCAWNGIQCNEDSCNLNYLANDACPAEECSSIFNDADSETEQDFFCYTQLSHAKVMYDSTLCAVVGNTTYVYDSACQQDDGMNTFNFSVVSQCFYTGNDQENCPPQTSAPTTSPTASSPPPPPPPPPVSSPTPSPTENPTTTDSWCATHNEIEACMTDVCAWNGVDCIGDNACMQGEECDSSCFNSVFGAFEGCSVLETNAQIRAYEKSCDETGTVPAFLPQETCVCEIDDYSYDNICSFDYSKTGCIFNGNCTTPPTDAPTSAPTDTPTTDAPTIFQTEAPTFAGCVQVTFTKNNAVLAGSFNPVWGKDAVYNKVGDHFKLVSDQNFFLFPAEGKWYIKNSLPNPLAAPSSYTARITTEASNPADIKNTDTWRYTGGDGNTYTRVGAFLATCTSSNPTDAPTEAPPTEAPTNPPTEAPTKFPTNAPTNAPTGPPSPTKSPTKQPTNPPTATAPTTAAPTNLNEDEQDRMLTIYNGVAYGAAIVVVAVFSSSVAHIFILSALWSVGIVFILLRSDKSVTIESIKDEALVFSVLVLVYASFVFLGYAVQKSATGPRTNYLLYALTLGVSVASFAMSVVCTAASNKNSQTWGKLGLTCTFVVSIGAQWLVIKTVNPVVEPLPKPPEKVKEVKAEEVREAEKVNPAEEIPISPELRFRVKQIHIV